MFRPDQFEVFINVINGGRSHGSCGRYFHGSVESRQLAAIRNAPSLVVQENPNVTSTAGDREGNAKRFFQKGFKRLNFDASLNDA
jgi:hypothetical protein